MSGNALTDGAVELPAPRRRQTGLPASFTPAVNEEDRKEAEHNYSGLALCVRANAEVFVAHETCRLYPTPPLLEERPNTLVHMDNFYAAFLGVPGRAQGADVLDLTAQVKWTERAEFVQGDLPDDPLTKCYSNLAPISATLMNCLFNSRSTFRLEASLMEKVYPQLLSSFKFYGDGVGDAKVMAQNAKESYDRMLDNCAKDKAPEKKLEEDAGEEDAGEEEADEEEDVKNVEKAFESDEEEDIKNVEKAFIESDVLH